jgi:hypothetical protein
LRRHNSSSHRLWRGCLTIAKYGNPRRNVDFHLDGYGIDAQKAARVGLGDHEYWLLRWEYAETALKQKILLTYMKGDGNNTSANDFVQEIPG